MYHELIFIYIWQHSKLLGVLTPLPSSSLSKHRPLGLVLKLGIVKAKGREPKTCLGRVFNYKLGSYDYVHVLTYVDARPHLWLKTQPWFHPLG
jgi:hypothetical protein